MNKKGPIIVIEDDIDDQELLQGIFDKLEYQNKIMFFPDGDKALEYLNITEEQPFLILCDVNMPKINGFELRAKISTDQQLVTKCIPYLFFTTGATKKMVLEAYALSVQGFFVKPNHVDDLESTIKKIVEYWQECISPGEYL